MVLRWAATQSDLPRHRLSCYATLRAGRPVQQSCACSRATGSVCRGPDFILLRRWLRPLHWMLPSYRTAARCSHSIVQRSFHVPLRPLQTRAEMEYMLLQSLNTWFARESDPSHNLRPKLRERATGVLLVNSRCAEARTESRWCAIRTSAMRRDLNPDFPSVNR